MSLANPQSYWDPSSEADLRNELLADCHCCLHPSCDSVTCIKDQHAAVWGMTALFADSYILELPLPSLLHSKVCTTWWVLWHIFRSNSPGRCCLALELLIAGFAGRAVGNPLLDVGQAHASYQQASSVRSATVKRPGQQLTRPGVPFPTISNVASQSQEPAAMGQPLQSLEWGQDQMLMHSMGRGAQVPCSLTEASRACQEGQPCSQTTSLFQNSQIEQIWGPN